MRTSISLALLAAVAMIGSTAVSAAESTGKTLYATLSGANEVNGGDPDGTGMATVRINPGRGTLCYSINVSNIAPATMAHVHDGDAGSAGPVVRGLTAPTSGSSEGCATISRELAISIITDPEGYYVNVHNAEYPGGAIRGQLEK